MKTENNKPVLKLPRISYGPICLKILNEFIEHHKFVPYVQLPQPKEKAHEFLAKLFDLMLHSMGEEKRKQAIKEADAYYNDLPPSVR